jgi:CheY-like chemotaxis protein
MVQQPHALIIEDNSKNALVLANLLAKRGVSSTRILNPGEALPILQTIERVDLVFLDLEMPGQNGYDVLSMIRADSRYSHLPVIAYTVHVSEIHHAYEMGFHSFLPKPLDPDRFPDQIARILKGENVWELV